MTYAELKQYIQDYLENSETTFVSYLDKMIHLAEEDIYRQVQLKDLKATATGSLSASTRSLTLPSDFLAPYYFRLTTSGSEDTLLQKDVNFIYEVYPADSTEGAPRFYAIEDDDNIIFGPVPDAAYTYELHYYYKPASLTAGGDSGTTWLSTNGEQALLFGCLIQGYIFMKGDQDVMNHYKEQYAQAIANLKLISEGRADKDTYRKPNNRIPV